MENTKRKKKKKN